MREGSLPAVAKLVAGVFEVVAVGSEDFEGDGAVVAAFVKGVDGAVEIEGAAAESHVEVGVAAFVVVQVDVAQAMAPAVEDVVGGVVGHQEIGVADVEVEAEVGEFAEEFAELMGVVEVAGQVFDHEADVEAVAVGLEFGEGLDVFVDVEGAGVEGGVAIGVDVHPFGADLGEGVETGAEFFDGGAAEGFKGAGDGEVVGGVAYDIHVVCLEEGFDGGKVGGVGAGGGGFQG